LEYTKLLIIFVLWSLNSLKGRYLTETSVGVPILVGIYNPTISKITITEINTRKQRIIDMMKDDEDLGLYSPV